MDVSFLFNKGMKDTGMGSISGGSHLVPGTPTAYEICVAKLRAYLQPSTNVMAERVAFQRTGMAAGESFAEYRVSHN